MKRIVNQTEMKKWENAVIGGGIPARVLMLHAAEGLYEAVLKTRSANQTVTVFCGTGNNGGDGFALACLLQENRIPVRIVFFGDPDRMTEDAAFYMAQASRTGVPVSDGWNPCEEEILIDAMLGTGTNRNVSGKTASFIDAINNSGKSVISADIPSGLDANTGSVWGIAVHAAQTVTMQFLKAGLLLGNGRKYSGVVTICELISEDNDCLSDLMYLQEICDVDYLLPKRPFDSYKGANGHVLLCVGSNQYTGAALLAARSALRAGCGLLTVCTPDPVRSFFSSLPEVITIPTATDTWNETACKTAADAIAKKNAVGIGCGIGSADIAPLLREALNAHIPLVIDADGLNCLSRNRSLFTLLHDKVVLTPHVGEMARLLDCTVQDVLSDSLSAVRSFPCIVLLKGPTTLVSDGRKTAFCTEGTPLLAKGGSGDVLTGIIASLLGQGLSPFDAARTGSFLLGTTAKTAFQLLGERMLMASDIIDTIGF